jgi:hypothetical protein
VRRGRDADAQADSISKRCDPALLFEGGLEFAGLSLGFVRGAGQNQQEFIPAQRMT